MSTGRWVGLPENGNIDIYDYNFRQCNGIEGNSQDKVFQNFQSSWSYCNWSIIAGVFNGASQNLSDQALNKSISLDKIVADSKILVNEKSRADQLRLEQQKQNPKSCSEYLYSLNLKATNSTNSLFGDLGLSAKVVPSGNIQEFLGLITEFNDKSGSIQGYSIAGSSMTITPISQGAFFNISNNTKFYINPKELVFNSTIVKIHGKYVNNRNQKYTNTFGRVESVVNPVVDAICIERN